MPYINQERRHVFSAALDHLKDVLKEQNLTEGDLNYIISTLLTIELEKDGISYGKVNGLIGVLECAKQELYRRVAGPYEDKKINENGDVY